ncbi:hypothetical protein ACFL4T_01700 [candidate division KSB1 bacterium]
MSKKVILILVFSIFFLNISGINLQSKKKAIELVGKIELKKDFWGRRIFKGKVKNYSKNRIDFIRVDFEMYDKNNKLIISEGAYIDGIKFVFGDATESRSSLKPGATGPFDVYTSIPADSIAQFTYKINYKYFKYR